MTYRLLQIFCSTPGELEEERLAFHEVVGQVNQGEGIAKGVLFAPVSILPHMANKTFFQPSVDDNVRDSKFFVQILHDTWGPPHKNFAREFEMALRSKAGSEIAVFLKAGGISLSLPPEIAISEFTELGAFQEQLHLQLSAWLGAI